MAFEQFQRSRERSCLRRVTVLLALLAIILVPGRAQAFKEQGHRSIEAAAYQHLIDDGNADVLVALIHAGLLRGRLPLVKSGALVGAPPFSPASEDEEQVGGVWLGSHLPDHSFAHQLESYGQCFHFMARAEDVEDSPPGDDIPEGLSKNAYTRCISLLDILVRGVLFDPQGSRRRSADAYALIHMVEDSFSEAHTARTEDWKISYLKPWRLRTWLPYLFIRPSSDFPWVKLPHGLQYGLNETHHGAFEEERDYGYLNERIPACKAQQTTLVYIGCLSPRGLKAADAVAELLILLAKHVSCAHQNSCLGFEDDWNEYKLKYFQHEIVSVSATYEDGDLLSAKHGIWTGDLLGPSDYIDHPPPSTLGLGLATDFADATESLWLTADVFVTADPMKQHEIRIVDLLSYSLQIRLPLQTETGERPAGAAAELGLRIPVDVLSNDLVTLYVGARLRGAALVSRVANERTRTVFEGGFGGVNADLVLFQRVWVGVEAPRYLWIQDNLGPDAWSQFWTVKAGAALNAL